MDTPDVLVDSNPLSKQLDIEIRNDGKQAEESEIINSIWTLLETSKHPIILADVLAHRYGAVQDVRRLVEICKVPVSISMPI
jgi:pyruvate decarboxylase